MGRQAGATTRMSRGVAAACKAATGGFDSSRCLDAGEVKQRLAYVPSNSTGSVGEASGEPPCKKN